MRITRLWAIQPPTEGSPSDWRTQLGQIVVTVETDEGLSGIGVGGGGAAGIHVVETVLADLLIGRDPLAVRDLHREMCRHTAFYGRKGLAVMALSGVDLALWDLLGKAKKMPVASLLNADVQLDKEYSTYVTVFDEVDTQAAIHQGHAGIKLHVERFGLDATAVARQVEKIRHAVGDEIMVMMDAFGQWDIRMTLQVAQAVKDLAVGWIEEPLQPDDRSGYQRLVAESPVPIAGGEHEYLIEGFQDLVEQQMHVILQPDINWCGGLTSLIDIYELAQANGLQVCPHRGSEVFALHAIAALDPQPLAESPRSWFNCLRGAPAIKQGKVRLSHAPGFAVEYAD